MTGQEGYWLEEVPPKGQKQGSECQKTDALKTAQGWEKSWQASCTPGQTARPSPCLVRGDSLEAKTIKQEVTTKCGVFLQRKT